MDIRHPGFWRAGAISTTVVMLVVLAFLTVDSLRATATGGSHVPVIGGEQLLFGKTYTEPEARKLMEKGKLVIQSRACMDCHTFFGNGAYYAPDLTKAWLDPAWRQIWIPMTGAASREEAMVAFLMHPDRYPSWRRVMPDLGITETEARAVVAYLKWMSAIDTNGFPANFGQNPLQH